MVKSRFMTNESIRVRKVSSGKEMDAVFEIRQKVFVDEQQVDPEEEYDKFEDTSHHFIAFADDQPVGTARWRKTPNGIKLERFAVLSSHRNMGIGQEIVRAVLNDIPHRENIYLHSQLPACSLYRRFGFVQQGSQFEEANIMHYKMVLKD